MISILAIDDNSNDARLIELALADDKHGVYNLQHRTSLQDGLEAIEQGRFAAILLDLMLPDSTGLATFECMEEKHPALPIIVLTGQEDQDLALEAVRNGAQDYLVIRVCTKGTFCR